MSMFEHASSVVIGLIFGLFIALIWVESPRAPQFHETIGTGSRVSIFVNSSQEKFASFTHKGKEYTVALPKD